MKIIDTKSKEHRHLHNDFVFLCKPLYLRSDKWQTKRRVRMTIDEHACFVCGTVVVGSTGHIHHLHYKNAGNEDIDKDLVTLCKRCHNDIHEKPTYDKLSLLDMKAEFDDDKYKRDTEYRHVE